MHRVALIALSLLCGVALSRKCEASGDCWTRGRIQVCGVRRWGGGSDFGFDDQALTEYVWFVRRGESEWPGAVLKKTTPEEHTGA